MAEEVARTELLLGADGMEKLKIARVAVFGLGGVGGHAFEALVRSGVGTLDIFDNDTVALTNLNRQINAKRETLGKSKVDAAKERALSINPNVTINAYNCFFMPETADEFDFTNYDYVIDAIDTVKGKLEIIMRANDANVPVISCMGAGNKLDPTKFEVTDIYKTSVCPLARTMRYELRRRGIKKLKVVYSKEEPIKPAESSEQTVRRSVPGSTAFVPAIAGLIAAGEAVKDIALS
ncbi:MAG: tRNA threonylcarbamoyladenosine dehydratase [Clostridia bacterium]|nr:tRNA threonylcarbamoyladenosine dehydratase [Clostridia bacterium]